MSLFVTRERRVWMRLRDHAVVFERDPDFPRFAADPSGGMLRILLIWVAEPCENTPTIRHYIGSVRHWQSGGWGSHRELMRLFRRATRAAPLLGESATSFRARLSTLLRRHFCEVEQPATDVDDRGQPPIGRAV